MLCPLNRPPAQRAEVGDKQKLHPLHELAAGHRKAYQDDEQHEQGRHEDAHRLLQTGPYATGNDNRGHDHEDGVPGEQPLRVAD